MSSAQLHVDPPRDDELSPVTIPLFHRRNLVADEFKRLARSAGSRLKRDRPRTTPRLHKGEMSDLIEATSNGLEAFSGHTLQFFHHIQVQFGLTPRQYLMWVAKFVRRGKCMIRKCLLCGGPFLPSILAKEVARHAREIDDAL